jgi:hypothetical protein
MPAIKTRGDGYRDAFFARWTDHELTAVTGQPATFTRASRAPATDAAGRIYSVNAGREAFGYVTDSQGVRRGGLLTLRNRSNALQRPTELTHASWSKLNGAVVTEVDGAGVWADGRPLNRITHPGSGGGSLRVERSDGVWSASDQGFVFEFFRGTSASVVYQFVRGPTVFCQFTVNLATLAVTVAAGAPSVTVALTERGSIRVEGVVTVPSDATGQTRAWRIYPSGTGVVAGHIDSVWMGWFVAPNDRFGPPLVPAQGADGAATSSTDQVSYANFPQPAEIAARGGITVYWAGGPLGLPTANAFNLRIGEGGTANTNRVWEFATISSLYRFAFRNGLGSSSSPSFAIPAASDRVEVLMRLEYRVEGGERQFRSVAQVVVNGVAQAVSAAGYVSAEDAIANGWSGSPTLHIGARDGGNDASFNLNQALKARFGIHDLASMRAG